MSLLTWDSEFFGKRIGQSGGDPARSDALARELDLDCLYFFTSLDEAEEAESLGFRLMDVRLIFVRASQPSVQRPLRPPTREEVDLLARYARTAFHDTRFSRDYHFDRERVEDMYEHWLRRSYDGWAQCVRVAERKERATGFVTIRDRKIDLIASVLQGEGIGQELVTGAVNCAYDLGIPEVRVSTQAENVTAVRLYERCGFLLEDTRLIFHKWFSQPMSTVGDREWYDGQNWRLGLRKQTQ